jgi:hypothetical protein
LILNDNAIQCGFKISINNFFWFYGWMTMRFTHICVLEGVKAPPPLKWKENPSPFNLMYYGCKKHISYFGLPHSLYQSHMSKRQFFFFFCSRFFLSRKLIINMLQHNGHHYGYIECEKKKCVGDITLTKRRR